MGCVSSKILAKSGSFQETVSLGHSFQRSSVIEEIILSSSKSNGGQFLALLRTSSSSARKPELHSPAAAAVEPEPAAKIETINVSELLAGLEEESCTPEQERERQKSRKAEGDGSPAPWRASDGSAAGTGRARSFRTLEEFDAMLTQQQRMQSGSPERALATALVTEQEEPAAATAATTSTAEAAGLGGSEATAGAKRRARARQLGELRVPAAFDFSKSGSLRDWLRQGGQTFSPGSYVTPKFGTVPPALPPAEQHGGVGVGDGEDQEQALFDPELVAQFERAMEQLSEDEILEALELEAAGRVSDDQAADMAAVQQV